MLNIRKAVKSDAEAVCTLAKALHEFHATARPELFNLNNPEVTEKLIKKTITSKNNIVFVAEKDDEIIGFCSASLNEKYYNNAERSAFIDDFYVVPKERNKGIATSLFNELKAYVTAWGAFSLDLCVWAFNSEARAFYDKMGMKTQRAILEMKL